MQRWWTIIPKMVDGMIFFDKILSCLAGIGKFVCIIAANHTLEQVTRLRMSLCKGFHCIVTVFFA